MAHGAKLVFPLLKGTVRLGAIGTKSIELQFVAVDGKAMRLCHLFLELLDIHVFKFDDLLALGADQVVVMVDIVGQFIPGVPVAELPLLRQAAFAEEIQGAVDRRQPDRGVLLPHHPV